MVGRFLYRLLRVANVVGRVDEPKLRAAMSSPSVAESITRLAEFDKPLSYSLAFTGEAMSPLLNGGGPGSRDTLVIRQLHPVPHSFPNRVYVDDVVVIEDPEDARRKYVRRIAAMEGSEMVSSEVGDAPFRIPPEHCWVVRENPSAASARDSTFFGPLGLKHIVGRVMYAIRSSVDHGRISYSPYGMATDEIVLRQELVAPHIDEHGRRVRSEAAKREADERGDAAPDGKE
jgi:hypothetical protein